MCTFRSKSEWEDMKRLITVKLEKSPDYPALFEVVDISSDKIGSLESCLVLGIPEVTRLEIGSWLRRKELGRVRQLPTQNKHIKFLLPNSE